MLRLLLGACFSFFEPRSFSPHDSQFRRLGTYHWEGGKLGVSMAEELPNATIVCRRSSTDVRSPVTYCRRAVNSLLSTGLGLSLVVECLA